MPPSPRSKALLGEDSGTNHVNNIISNNPFKAWFPGRKQLTRRCLPPFFAQLPRVSFPVQSSYREAIGFEIHLFVATQMGIAIPGNQPAPFQASWKHEFPFTGAFPFPISVQLLLKVNPWSFVYVPLTRCEVAK